MNLAEIGAIVTARAWTVSFEIWRLFRQQGRDTSRCQTHADCAGFSPFFTIVSKRAWGRSLNSHCHLQYQQQPECVGVVKNAVAGRAKLIESTADTKSITIVPGRVHGVLPGVITSLAY